VRADPHLLAEHLLLAVGGGQQAALAAAADHRWTTLRAELKAGQVPIVSHVRIVMREERETRLGDCLGRPQAAG
jgi:hypothetical protein